MVSVSAHRSEAIGADDIIACRENDITDVLDETFTVEDERFGEMLTLELVPGGADIALTEENKQQWVK
jgi:hypothetical protein